MRPLPHFAAAALLPLLVSPALAQSSAVSPADAQSTAIVEAANGFLATLSAAELDAASFAFDDADQRTNWSNLPNRFFSRAGLRWENLGQEQRDALMDLLGTILSPQGLEMVEHQMLAEDQLRAQNGDTFGSANFYVSLLGEPSTDAPWMLQFGGHHLALNATVAGADVTLSPMLTGGQPIRFSANGQDIEIVGHEVAAATALYDALSAEQQDTARIGGSLIGPFLGAGEDGTVLPPEGVAGSALDDTQRGLLLSLIATRIELLNADDSAAAMAAIEANLGETYFAWAGASPDMAASYWRVTGPSVVLEFAPQTRDGDEANHLHNIYRDPTNDYGANWVAID